MATSGEMIAIVADALGEPTATVNSYYRMLREAGLVTKGGRGRSAPHMAAEDVAKLLITVMGSEKLDEATAKCQLLSDAQFSGGMTEDFENIEGMEAISLLDAVVKLLVQVKQGEAGAPKALPLLPILGDVSRSDVTLEICTSTLEAWIMSGEESLPFQCVAEPPAVTDPDDWPSLPMQKQLLAKALQGGMITTRSVDQIVLVRVSRALPEETTS